MSLKEFVLFFALSAILPIISTEVLAFEEPPTLTVTKPTGGSTYYINASAGGGGDGSSGSPWNDIDDADGNVSPGDTIKIKGTFGTGNSITWSQSGSPGNEIVFEPWDATATLKHAFFCYGNYVIFDGGSNRNIVFNGEDNSKYTFYVYSDHVTLYRCKLINNLKNSGCCSATNISGAGGDNLKIYNCEVYGSRSAGIYIQSGDNVSIKNNLIHDNEGQGLQVNPHDSNKSVSNIEIIGNAIYDNGSGIFGDSSASKTRGNVIVINQPSDGSGVSGATIANNLIWNATKSGMQIGDGSGNSRLSSVTIYNNTIYISGWYGIDVYDNEQNSNYITIKNNIVLNGTSGNLHGTSGYTLAANLTTNPSFVSTNEANDNFLKLSSDSNNAIDQGYDLISEGITEDYFGNSRPKRSGYDIGAHEYGLEGPANLKITNVTYIAPNFNVTLDWDPTDDSIGYKVYYKSGACCHPYGGTGIIWNSQKRDSPFDVGNLTEVVLVVPDDDKVYFFAVKAYYAALESDYSNEVNTKAPQITSAPTVISVTNDSAIIEWTTDERGTSMVQYGDNPADWGSYGFIPAELTDYVTNHSFTLKGLGDGHTYHYRVGSTDADGYGPTTYTDDNNPSGDYTFKTESSGDVTPPHITSVPTVILITDDTATIKWETDEAADSEVRYDIERHESEWAAYDTSPTAGSHPDSALVTSHSITLINLIPDTDYYFMVGSTDSSGNGPTTSLERSFHTNKPSDTIPPTIISSPTVISKSDKTAIIAWTTDEPSTSVVQYGTDIPYTSESSLADYVTNHSVTLTGLNPDTLYHFRVSSVDEVGNGPTYSGDYTFRTEEEDDQNPPVITVQPTVIGITHETATIRWETDEPSNSTVEYQPNLAGPPYDHTESDAGNVTVHTVTITTGLTPDTLYHFRVSSVDQVGNGPTYSGDYTFRTEEEDDQNPPVITVQPTVIGITHETATIRWETDEPSNSMVEYVSHPPGLPYEHSESGSDNVTIHTITITGLTPETLYQYRASSADPDGHTTNSNNFTFTTNPTPDTASPVITVQPTVIAKTHNTATIRWETDETSNSTVEYYDSLVPETPYDHTESDADNVTIHTVTITGLNPYIAVTQGTYTFRVRSVDQSGNVSDYSNDFTFTTEQAPDTVPPVITVQPTVIAKTHDTATIRWETDETSNSTVEYYDSLVPETPYDHTESDADNVTIHTVTITGLNPYIAVTQGTYTFRVRSVDQSGNVSDYSNDFTFTTEQAPDTVPPVITVQPTVIAKTHNTATIRWETDETGNSTVEYESDPLGLPYDHTKSNADNVTIHTVTISGLTPDTLYHFRVGSVDQVGNGPTYSGDDTFTTDVSEDTTKPLITNLDVIATTDTTATITWETEHDPSNSTVEYESDPLVLPYDHTESDADNVTVHTVTITGLDPETPYRFRVSSVDQSGNQSLYSESTFTTDVSEDTTKPLITNLDVIATTDTTATITWETEHDPSNSTVEYESDPLVLPYDHTESDADNVTVHTVTITGLDPETPYRFRVSSVDQSGNQSLYSESTFTTQPAPADDVNPEIIGSTVDSSKAFIDITYSEPMQNADIETNYEFDPELVTDEIIYLGLDTYRLLLSSLPYYTIFELTDTGDIKDLAGNPVNPGLLPLRINDDDNDNLPDDWEVVYDLNPNSSDGDNGAYGDPDNDGLTNIDELANDTEPNNSDTDYDDLPDGWEVNYGLDPLDSTGDNGRDGDFDRDGWTNYQEYINGTNPNDSNDTPSLPDEIKEVIPHHNAGIIDATRVPNNTSFAVRIEDSDGIDTTDLESIKFTIDDGVNFTYEYNLGNTGVVRVVQLDSTETEDNVTKLWAVYDRSKDDWYGNVYSFGATVTITVNVKDGMILGRYSFKVETQEQHNDAEDNIPPTRDVDPNDPALEGSYVYDIGAQISSGQLNGAKILYDSDEPVIPTFGPTGEIPALNISGVNAVGIPMNLQPPTVFNTPVEIFIPCPGYPYVNTLSIYRYSGKSWVLACDHNGTVQPGGEGWMVPGSRVNHNSANGSTPTIEIQVYHFSGVQAGSPSGSVGRSTSEVAGGGCFIATAAYGSDMNRHVKILSEFRDRYLLTNPIGRGILEGYYRFSPSVASYLHKHPLARAIVRYALVPITGIAYISLFIHPLALLFAFIFMLLTGVYFFKRSKIRSRHSAM